ncbi:hypothetical protein FRC01_005922 [Tulasnella sp. 417]|nr:hypothetical protein FRC01_005922 [Tulasnella sp. 417]
MRYAILAAASAAVAPVAQAAFGYTSSGGYWTVDAGSDNTFVFKVSQSSCDVTSLVFRGVEYQYSSQYTHIGSGLGSVTSAITTIGDYIKITCTTSTLTQYLVVKKADSTIYLATYTTAEPSIGELRYIARLKSDLLTTSAYPQSYSGSGTAGAVEGSDVYKDGSGYTYSKFYSSVRFIDDKAHWVGTSDGSVHVTMCMPGNAYESSSGGPFFRDINTDKTSTAGAHNLYFYMNSGHAQTESYRQGLHGPYALQFSRNGIPDGKTELTFFADLGISGYIKSVNNPTTIKFTLSSSQTGAATLRIGSTIAFAGGRPQVTVNSWLGPAPGAPVDLNSRGFTRGTYRGNNVIYEVSIPSGVLVSGTNNIYINVISGSSGDTFLSPNFVYDAVALWTAGGSTGTTTTKTTTTTTTSKTGTTTTTSSSGGTVAAYGQCGGSGWTGGTVCVSGYTCTYSNEWYSQCIPN